MFLDVRDRQRRTQYFSRLAEAFPVADRPACLLVTHLLPDREWFVNGIDAVAEVRSVLPKPKSFDLNVRATLAKKYSVDALFRTRTGDPQYVLDLLELRAAGREVILLDVGGYFAPTLSEVAPAFSGRIVGVVEDTENGYQKYHRKASATPLPCPVISVARSPLKDPEDYLVGQAVVFSTEALLRESGHILNGRVACVIGYGKLGRSIANLLHAKRVPTTVYDTEPMRLAEAMSHGFRICLSLEEGLSRADLVMCATGNRALQRHHFPSLRNGAFIATVTSSDDEIDMHGLGADYRSQQVHEFYRKFYNPANSFFLLNRGNAINFVHDAHVGPFIFLVQGEIVAAVSYLATAVLPPGLCETSLTIRQSVTRLWLESFVLDGYVDR